MTNLFCFSPWRPSYDVSSGTIVCPLLLGGIPSLTLRKYCVTFRFLLSVPPSTTIYPSSHHLCIPLLSFTVPCRPESPSRIHLPKLPPFPRNICLPLSPSLLLLSSSTRLCLSILCHHFNTHQTPRVSSTDPISVLFSSPDATIIYPSPQNICLPSIQTTSKICYNYTPTHLLPIYITPLYLYLSISLSHITHFISLLSITKSLSLSNILNLLVSRPLTHFITLYYWTIHSFTIFYISLYFLNLCHTHTHYLPSTGPLPQPSPFCPTKN